ncbi:LAG1 longevity assurance 3-like [Pyrus ussuriensis x Pyrus communis]|uniref:LAG1 longevity assurance 3-like n=1 Tax=Pyrus ussuriensis x Pyrus communis TaxID=2448454 RepID=A0A5N5HYJ0_9ROSA|nr:LAG1 longevity assurance 3-like [Pyrus ussuriensis x Pyrus communis]
MSGKIFKKYIEEFLFACLGSVVLDLHDTSDVFLEVGKMSKNGGAERIISLTFIIFLWSHLDIGQEQTFYRWTNILPC